MGFLNWLSRTFFKTPSLPPAPHDPQLTIDVVNARREKTTQYVKLNVSQFSQLCESRGIKIDCVGPPQDFSNIGQCKVWTKTVTLQLRFSGEVRGEMPKFHNQGVRMAQRMKKEYNL